MSDFCNMFRGNLGQTSPEYHKIVTDNKVFASMGLSSFTSGTLFEALKGNNKLTSGMGSSQYQVYKSIMGGNWLQGNDPAHLVWSELTKKYTYKRLIDYGSLYPAQTDPTNVERFINYNNDLVRGVFEGQQATPGVQEIIFSLDDCKTSMSGCLSWTVPFKYNFTPDVPLSNGCVHRVDVPFKLYFYDKDYQPDNKRHVISKGAPRFATVPTLSYGKPYSPTATRAAGSIAGDYAPPEQGGQDNPANTVNAELDINFNSSTGKWESGTKQMLARLLTDIDPVRTSQLPVEAVNTLTREDIQNVKRPTWTGDFTTGKAMPMEVHNGNPNLFGPVWSNNKCEEDKKDTIDVVNRAQKSFSAGDIVMLSFISGEWIVMDFGMDPVGKRKVGIGKWNFTNLIANSDSFFYDNRFRTMWNGRYEHIDGYDIASQGSQHYKPGLKKVGNQISPNAYEGHFETQYYLDYPYHTNTAAANLVDINGGLLNSLPDIAAINLGYKDKTAYNTAVALGEFITSNFIGAVDGYYQVTSFDMLDGSWGGLNANGNVIGRTRADIKIDGTQPDKMGEQAFSIYPFWGAFFPEGYNRKKLQELKQNSPGCQPMGKYAGYFHGVGDGKIYDISKDHLLMM